VVEEQIGGRFWGGRFRWKEIRGAVTFERLGMPISGNCFVVAGVDRVWSRARWKYRLLNYSLISQFELILGATLLDDNDKSPSRVR
jgi:hypothetical protein